MSELGDDYHKRRPSYVVVRLALFLAGIGFVVLVGLLLRGVLA